MQTLQNRVQRIPRLASFLVFTVALASLLITQAGMGWVREEAGTYISLLLASLSLWVVEDQYKLQNKGTRIAGNILALSVQFFCLASLAAYVLNWDFKASLLNHVARSMQPSSAVLIALLATGLLLLKPNPRPRSFQPAFLFFLTVLFAAFFVLISFLYREHTVYELSETLQISRLTAFCLAALALGAPFLWPHSWPTNVLTSPGLGGIMARKLLPFAIVVPLLFCWIFLLEPQLNPSNAGFGLTGLALVLILSLTFIVLFTSIRLDELDRQRSQASLREQDALDRLNSAVTAAQVGTWEVDFRNATSLWNTYAESIFGYESGTGRRPLGDFSDRLHPDDKRRVLRGIENANKDKQDYESEFRIVPREGEVRWVLSKGRCSYDENGNATVMRGTVMDITERKKSEATLHNMLERLIDSENRFRELADCLPQLVLQSEACGRITYLNRGWREYLGGGMGRIQSWRRVLHRDDLKAFAREARRARSERNLMEIEARLKNKDGRYQWFLIRAMPSFDSEGHTVKWFATATNIEQQKRLENQLAKALELRNEILCIASHELKTPITSLKLQTELIDRSIEKKGEAETYTAQNFRRLVRQTDRNVTRISKLVEEMLDVSRISGKLALCVERVSMSELLVESIERMQPMLQKEYCQVEVEIVRDAFGLWDKFRIDQVITNLLTNACRYGGGAPIKVSVNASEGAVELRVKDQGPGIAREDQDRIFQRFERASSSHRQDGLGLGLYIVREILREHNGSVRVESELGNGAEFIVRLPALSECPASATISAS